MDATNHGSFISHAMCMLPALQLLIAARASLTLDATVALSSGASCPAGHRDTRSCLRRLWDSARGAHGVAGLLPGGDWSRAVAGLLLHALCSLSPLVEALAGRLESPVVRVAGNCCPSESACCAHLMSFCLLLHAMPELQSSCDAHCDHI